MKTKPLLCTAAAALLLGASASVSSSQTINATLIDIAPGLNVSGSFDGANHWDVYAGVLNFTTFEAFCTEPMVSMNYGDTYTYEVTHQSFLSRADEVNRLITAYHASAKTDEDAAAVQWAIWEVVTETGSVYSLSSGEGLVFISPSDPHGIAALANSYLADMYSHATASSTYLVSDNGQNVINMVPEPSSFLLAASASLLLFRRRRL